jgi:hypothetical protein
MGYRRVQASDLWEERSNFKKVKRGVLMKKRRTVVNTIAFLTFSTMLTAAQMQMPASTDGTNKPAARAPQTLTGTISDSMCGAHHMAKDKGAAECTRECVSKGMNYALIVGQKVYTLNGHEADLGKLAGKRATVKGSVTGETVMVESVAAAKKVTQ